MADATDAQLVSLTRSGDRDAYGALVARYQGHVYGLAYSLVGNWADAQDIAQETFIRAYANLDQLRDPARFPAWLRRVTFSVAMNWMKAFRPALFQQLDGHVDLDTLEIPDFRPGPAEVVEKRELADAVQRAIASLPAKYRVPLTMFHLDGLSVQKVADFLDIPLGSAKTLIHRARRKLKATLAPFAPAEVTPMVQEVFNEHRLPEEFARKVLDNVPKLGWGTRRQCTFAGALEAALAVTDHPYSYTEIMGYTGLALRVRWFCGNERVRWCGSSAVGEMEEEIAAAGKATGWPLRVAFLKQDDEAQVASLTAEIVASINAGRPVLAYEPRLNMDVVFGYEDGGKVLLLRDYFQPDEPLRLPSAKLGFLILFLGDCGEPMPRRDAFVEGLKIAVHNWRRERGKAGPGEYWYGDAALAHWMDDLSKVDQFSEDEKAQLFGIGWFNFDTMVDARHAAVAFLRGGAALVNADAREALERAAALYEQEAKVLDAPFAEKNAFLGPTTGGSMVDWSDEMRRRERAILTQAREISAAAIAELDQVLSLTDRS